MIGERAAGLVEGPQPLFTLIYVVHGDASYGYHDSAGHRHLADTEAVAQALQVGRTCTRAEVFIFHQVPGRWPFRKADGVLWHFRQGRLIHHNLYSRAGTSGDFGPEAGYYHKYVRAPQARAFRAPSSPRVSPVFFCYFGHEIPVTTDTGYSRSYPMRTFSLADFLLSLDRFSLPEYRYPRPFSLVVLSACNGGNPMMTWALAPYAEYVLASPGNLHLSFFDTRALLDLDRENPAAWDRERARTLGEALAQGSFRRLRENTSTAIAVALYDMDEAYPYLDARRESWDRNRMAGAGAPVYRDCGENESFGPGGMQAGAEVFYQPPRFGSRQGKRAHSGWECAQ